MFLNSNNEQQNYPNDDYLYNKITSLPNKDSFKIYICAFTINKNLETPFVKYIVQRNNSNVTLPFFIFESQNNSDLRLGEMSQPQQPVLPQQPLFDQPQQPVLPQQPLFDQPQQPVLPQPQPLFDQPQQPVLPQPQPLFDQPQQPVLPQQQPVLPQPQPLFDQPQLVLPQQQSVLPQQQPVLPQQPPQQQQPVLPQPQQQKPNFYPGINGGYLDDSTIEDNLDVQFKTQIINFVKTMYNNSLEPTYIGFIPNISEQNSIFAFVKIDDIHNNYFSKIENSEYIESTVNELFFLFKVFNLDVDQLIKDLFTNNQWLYVQESLASPFTGYLCKLEGSEIKNVIKNEGDPSTFLINIDNIGDFFYFSFLPIDLQNASLYKRYALFPMEYECILDNNDLDYYKQNQISYQNINSIYFKDNILLSNKNHFFAIKSPRQFTEI